MSSLSPVARLGEHLTRVLGDDLAAFNDNLASGHSHFLVHDLDGLIERFDAGD